MAVSGEEFGDLRDRVTRVEERLATHTEKDDDRHRLVMERLEGGEQEFGNQRRHIDAIGDRLNDHVTDHPRCDDPACVVGHPSLFPQFPVPGPDKPAPSVRDELDKEEARARERFRTVLQVLTVTAVVVSLLIPWVCNVRPSGGIMP